MRVEVQFIEPPASLLVARIGQDWKNPDGKKTNKDLGEFAKQERDRADACEADKASIVDFIEDFKRRMGVDEK